MKSSSPPRFRRLGLAAAGCVASALALGAATCGPKEWTGEPPNVLIVVIDTCRGDRCGFNGYGRPTTPALQAFAETAVTFTDAWTPGSWTGPGHASLFTGLRPVQHGLVEGIRLYLDDGFETLAERLGANGWKTGAFSNNAVVSPAMNLTQGFETFEPMYLQLDQTASTAAGTHEKVLAWIADRESAGERWFTFINHMEPHLPYHPTDAVRKSIEREGFTPEEVSRAMQFGPPFSVIHGLGHRVVDEPMQRSLSRLYDGEVEVVDDALGDFLDRLRETGVLDRTLVIITSDHGENLGDHGLYDHRMSLHRSLLHIPLIVRLPGLFDGGRTETDVVRLEDVAPTVYEVCKVPPTPGMQGQSLIGDTGGRVARAVHGTLERFEAPLREQFPSLDTSRLNRGIRSVYDGRHHLIRYDDGTVELYDVEADPAETRDLSRQEPALVQRLTELDLAD